MTIFKRSGLIGLAFLAAAATAAQAEYESKQGFAVVAQFSDSTMWFEVEEMPKQLENVMLTISGPREYLVQMRTRGDLPKLELRKFGKLFDGEYTWEITAATDEVVEVNSTVDANGRDAKARGKRRLFVAQSGAFRVRDGEVQQYSDKEER